MYYYIQNFNQMKQQILARKAAAAAQQAQSTPTPQPSTSSSSTSNESKQASPEGDVSQPQIQAVSESGEAQAGGSSVEQAPPPLAEQQDESEEESEEEEEEEQLPAGFFDTSAPPPAVSSSSSTASVTAKPIISGASTVPGEQPAVPEPTAPGAMPQAFFDKAVEQIDFSKELAAFGQSMTVIQQVRKEEMKVSRSKLLAQRKKEAKHEATDLKNWLSSVKNTVGEKRKASLALKPAKEKKAKKSILEQLEEEDAAKMSEGNSDQDESEEEEEDDDWDFDPEELCGWRSKKVE